MAVDVNKLKLRQTNFRNKMDILKKSKKELLKSFRNKLEEKKADEIKKKLLE